MNIRIFVFPSLIFFFVFSSTLSTAPDSIFRYADRIHPDIASTNMVVTQNELATEAGYQILEQGGNAVDVFVRFVDFVDEDVWLTVRRDNERAKKFYDKVGMEIVGEVFWSKGTLAGDVYIYRQNPAASLGATTNFLFHELP